MRAILWAELSKRTYKGTGWSATVSILLIHGIFIAL